MGINWVHIAPTLLASFLESLVEFIVHRSADSCSGCRRAVRGWRGAVSGAGLALLVLALFVLALGPAIEDITQVVVQLGLGVLLLLFGMRWLRKAILRSSCVITLHDEEAAGAKETTPCALLAALRRMESRGGKHLLQDYNGQGHRSCVHCRCHAMGDHGLLIPASLDALAALVWRTAWSRATPPGRHDPRKYA